MRTEERPGSGWGITVVLALIAAALSVVNPALLIFVPLSFLLIAVPPRRPLLVLLGLVLLGATFTGLAYTFTVGGHIRVDLLHNALPEKVQRILDIVVTVIALSSTALGIWYSVLLTYDSYDFGDVSIGMVPVPLWIPQAVMVVGLAWLLIALLDTLVGLVTGRITHLKVEAPQE